MNGILTKRKKIGITQSELARLLGVTQANISAWENGTALPSASKLPELAKALNCTIDELYENA